MTDSPIDSSLDQAGATLDAFAQGPVQRSAQALEDAFARASARIATDLGKAAAQGELSFSRMAANVLSDLARIAINNAIPGGQSRDSGANLLADAFGAAVRGLGGGKQSVNIAMQVHGVQADTIARSKGQVAQSLAQAVSDGMRRL